MFARSALIALAAVLLSAGCGGHPATAPAAPSAPAANGREARIAVVWGAEPDQERYRLAIESEARAALAKSGWRLESGPLWTIRIDRIEVETPFENLGMPAPGTNRTPTVRVRPTATLTARLLTPAGDEQEISGLWKGVYNTPDPEAYHDLAFQRAAERLAERVAGRMGSAPAP